MNANQQEADRWLKQAQHDLRAAGINRQAEFSEIACFLAQQAAEKALKAYAVCNHSSQTSPARQKRRRRRLRQRVNF